MTVAKGLGWGLPWETFGLPLLLAVATGCTDAAAPVEEAPTAAVVGVEAEAGPLVRTLRIQSALPTTVQVDYWAPASPRLRVTQSSPATEHAVLLPGLRAAQVYDYEVRVPGADPARAPLARGQVTTDSLPSDLAGVRFTALGTPTRRLTMVELRGTQFAGYVIVDQDGEVVWFQRSVAESFTRLANGDFVLLDGYAGLTELRPDLTVVAELPSTPDLLIHHDVIVTPGQTVLFLAKDPAPFEGEIWVGDAIWEWNPADNTLRRRWSARDFLSPARDLGPKSVPGDWLHANSLALGPRGNVVVSLPALNQVISIAPGFASLEWRLGGPNATVTPESDAEFWFEHTAAEIAPGRVLLFDNGRDRPGGLYSRALELELDLAHGTARRVWEFRPRPDIYAPIIGSARRLGNGHTVANFGTSSGILGASGPITAFETAPDGQIPWILRIAGDGLLNYRATQLDDIAGEVVVRAAR